jgi:hypothetical protein
LAVETVMVGGGFVFRRMNAQASADRLLLLIPRRSSLPKTSSLEKARLFAAGQAFRSSLARRGPAATNTCGDAPRFEEMTGHRWAWRVLSRAWDELAAAEAWRDITLPASEMASEIGRARLVGATPASRHLRRL